MNQAQAVTANFTSGNPVTNVSGNVSVAQSGFTRNRATGSLGGDGDGYEHQRGSHQRAASGGLDESDERRNDDEQHRCVQWQSVHYGLRGGAGSGASVSLIIWFSNPSNGYIAYTPVTYSGML